MRRPDRHNEVELNFLQSGWLTYLLGGRKVRVAPQRLSTFWAAIPHQIIEYADDTEYFVATIPLAWFLQCKLPENLVHPILHGHLVSEAENRPALSDGKRFVQWESDLRGSREDLQKAVLLEMEARLLRLAAGQPVPEGPRGRSRKRQPTLGEGGLSRVERMACLIAQRYTEHLTVSEIGRAVGLHPNYADEPLSGKLLGRP